MSDAHAGPRASSRIFLHLVARGMDRAYRAAAAVEADHPGLEVETWLSYDDELLREDPETLPQVLFILQGDEQEQDGVHVSLAVSDPTPKGGGFPANQGVHPEVRWNFRLEVHPMCWALPCVPSSSPGVTYLHPALALSDQKFLKRLAACLTRRSFYWGDV